MEVNGASSTALIDGNVFRTTLEDGPAIQLDTTGPTQVSNNRITGYGNGIEVIGGSGHSITDNRIFDTADDGVLLANTTNLVFENNVVSTDTIGAPLHLDNMTDWTLSSTNWLDARGRDAIEIWDSTRITVDGTRITGEPGYTAVETLRDTETLVTNLTLCHEWSQGVRFEQATNSSVTSTSIVGSQIYGIDVIDSQNTTIDGVNYGGNPIDLNVDALSAPTTVETNAGVITLVDGDGDGLDDSCDPCPSDPANDADFDGICDSSDPCNGTENAVDADGDGYCSDTDCNDNDASINPGATEIAGDEIDQNCDLSELCYLDNDGDGFRKPGVLVSTAYGGCYKFGHVTASVPDGDCDDTNPYAWPGAPEWCGDGFDNDCSGAEDDNALDALTWYLDADADGFGGTSTALACEAPPDHTAVPGDCDDAVPEVFPGGTELCDGLDNDCNGDIDDDPVDPTPWYTDTDGDGYGDDASMVMACSGTLDVGGDCDDGDITVNPGALEVCGDGVDNDCDRTGCGLPQGDLDDDSAPLRIEGGTGFGASLAAGDLDGDGWDDLSVGEAGSAVHLFAGPLGAGSLTPQDAFATVLDGSGAETGLGQGSLVADVSGDGLADWVLAAPLTGMPTSADGALYALQGPLAPGGVDLSTASLSVMGPTTGGQLGHAMGLGALLGVGQSALVASAPQEPTGGAVYLFELPLAMATDTSAAFGPVLGFGAGDGWGSALTLSDWNGDGLVDLAVGAPGTANGDLCVFWGPIGAGSLAAADADLHWTGDAAGDALGSAIHAGDLNGDGATDLVVTSPGSDTVSIAWGPWFLASSPIGSAANVRVTGALSPEAQIHVGDLNHDGFDDLFVADPTAGTAAVDGGSAWVFFGPLTEDRTLDEADARIDGLAEGQSLGASLLVHDLDADGFVDLSLGAPTSDPANPTPSRTYHFFGASL